MFDPTVYENLKVVLEGSVYDLDLAGAIRVTARQDLIDLASMSRTFRLAFRLRTDAAKADEVGEDSSVLSVAEADFVLSTGLSDLAGEILELKSVKPGCSIDIFFTMPLPADIELERINAESEAVLRQVWGSRFNLRQTISYDLGETSPLRTNRIQLLFGRRFGEEVVEDIPNMLDHTVLTLSKLTERLARY